MRPLSLYAAILININIMLGAGLFINTTELALRAGALSWLTYALIGILMLPLILSIAQLVRMHPDGAFYTFGTKEINPFVGFISAWVYFTSKLASSTLTIYAAATLIHALIPSLHAIKPFYISSIILVIFGLLNTYNIRTGSSIQKFFLGAKIIPISFVILAGLFWFSSSDATSMQMIWEGIPSSMPLVMFAILGFEAACSLSNKIDNPAKNAPRAIIVSFLSVIGIYCLYQFFAYNLMSFFVQSATGYQAFFAQLATMIAPLQHAKYMGLLYCAVAASTLGGAYGILYSNVWNLHTLAKYNHIIAASSFLRLNKQHIPIMCVITEIFICFLYLFVSNGTPLPLQQIAATGCAFTYLISVCALLYAKANRTIHFPWAIAFLGMINCFMLAALCIVYLLRGAHPTLYVFGCLVLIGIGMYFVTKKESQKIA